MVSSPQAVQYGFKAAFAHPLVWGAELMWRWVSRFAFWLIMLYTFFSYLHSLPVSDSDRFMLSGVVPGLATEGLRHIISGSGGRLVKLFFLTSVAWSIFWWMVSSLGRSATLLGMMDSNDGSWKSNEKSVLAAISRIHAIRIAMNIVVFLAYCGVVALAEAKSRVPVVELHETQGVHTHNASMFWAIAIGLSLLVSITTTSLRWCLSLAPIYCTMYGMAVRDALRSAADVTSQRARSFSWVGFVHWIARLILCFSLLVLALSLMGLNLRMSRGIMWFAAIAVMLVWSAAGHFLRLAQMASWICIIAWDKEERNKPPTPVVVPIIVRPLLDPPIVPSM
jgi:hypothetical protein